MRRPLKPVRLNENQVHLADFLEHTAIQISAELNALEESGEIDRSMLEVARQNHNDLHCAWTRHWIPRLGKQLPESINRLIFSAEDISAITGVELGTSEAELVGIAENYGGDMIRRMVYASLVFSGDPAEDAYFNAEMILGSPEWIQEQLRSSSLKKIPSHAPSQSASNYSVVWHGQQKKEKPAKPEKISNKLTRQIQDLENQVSELQADNTRLKNRVSETKSQLRAEKNSTDSKERMQAQSTVSHQATEQIASLKARVHWLERALRDQRESGIDHEQDPLPTTWDELKNFENQRLAGNVVLTDKAIKVAQGSVFKNIPFAYQVLLMLAEDYVPMRRAEPGARERYEAKLAQLGISLGPTGSAIATNRYKQSYTTMYLGKRHTMDMHVQGSSSRDPELCFRLYFKYVDQGEDGYVLVGSFPAHLENYKS